MFVALLGLTFFYILCIVYVAIVFNGARAQKTEFTEKSSILFSVIISFRNEEHTLPILLGSIQQLDYPKDKVEFIFCDDHSEDNSRKIVESHLKHIPFLSKCMQNNPYETGKKSAITNAVMVASNPYIVTTDADCILPERWLQELSTCININNAIFVAGPVKYFNETKNNPFAYYQILENAALVLIGAVGFFRRKPFMANGANLCFQKSVFIDVNGYVGNLDIPSGDDEFLLQKFVAVNSERVVFCKSASAIVQTPIQPDISTFIQQRVRWASKVKKHRQKNLFLLQAILFVYYVSIVLNLVIGILHSNYFTAIFPVLLKLAGDLYFNWVGLHFFKLPKSLIYIVIASLMQLVLVPIVGLFSLNGNFTWKDRKYRI